MSIQSPLDRLPDRGGPAAVAARVYALDPSLPLTPAERTFLRSLTEEGAHVSRLALNTFADDEAVFIDQLSTTDESSLGELNRRGMGLDAQGCHYAAEGAFALALRQSWHRYGLEHPETLAVASNLAATLGAKGDFTTAREIQEWELDACRRALGDEDPSTLRSANNLAGTLRSLGDFATALRIHSAVLATSTRVLGPEHLTTLTSMNNLALSLRALGDLHAARELQEKVLKARRHLQGAHHPDTLTAVSNLASTQAALGHSAEARRMQDQVFKDRQRVLGPEHRDTLTAANNLATTLRTMGDYAGARAVHEWEFETSQRVLGSEHVDTLTSAGNLACVLRDQGDLHGARQLHEWEIEVCERVLGPDHDATLTAVINLALTFRAQGDLSTAREMLERVHATRQRVLGPEHPETLTVANSLAGTRRAQGDFAGARDLHRSTFEIRQRVLGPEHPQTLNSANNLGVALRALGDVAGARRIHEWEFEVCRRVCGPEHADTLVSANNFADALYSAGEVAACCELCVDVLRQLADAASFDAAAVEQAARLPPLVDPSCAWPAPSVQALLGVLPELSAAGWRQLALLPADGASAMYRALLNLHESWVAVASHHEPPESVPDRFLAILSPLHGSESWSRLGDGAIQSDRAAGLPEAQAFLKARERARAARSSLDLAVLHRAGCVERAATLQHRIARIRRGEAGVEGEDLEVAAATWRIAQEQAEKARIDLERLAVDQISCLDALECARRALADADPELRRLLDSAAPVTRAQIEQSLSDGDLWLVPLPEQTPQAGVNPDHWAEQYEGSMSYLLGLRRDHSPAIIPISPLGLLSAATAAWRDAVSGSERGLLRDNVFVPTSRSLSGGSPSGRAVTLSELEHHARDGFWEPLAPLLEGIARIHLVTAAGTHDLMLECGRPEELAEVQLLRYCGLPAYVRRQQERQEGPDRPSRALRRAWLYDEGEGVDLPIPFTSLDCLIPSLRGQGQPQGLEDLLEHGPVGDVLLVSAHGSMDGGMANRSGFLVLGKERVNPAALNQRGVRPLRALVAMCCFGGVVGVGGAGDALGTISALQLQGLHWAIACLAPVPDFYSPLFSAVLHDQLEENDPATALERTKSVLLRGPWDERLRQQVIEPLRHAYELRMRELVQQLKGARTEEELRRAELLAPTLHGWSLPAGMRHLLEVEGPAALLRHDERSLVRECADLLLCEPQLRDADDADGQGEVILALRTLAAVTVVFGRA